LVSKAKLKLFATDCLAALLSVIGLSSFSRLSKNSLLIITFHRVLPEHLRCLYPYPGLVVSPEELEWILRTLGKHYRITTTAEALSIFEQPNRQPALAVTFDDGQLDNYLYAKPVLDKLEIKGTFYLPVGNIEADSLIWHDKIGFPVARLLESTDSRCKLLNLLREEYGFVVHQESTIRSEDFINLVVEHSKQLPPEQRQALAKQLNEYAAFEIAPWAHLMSWQQIRELHEDGHEIGSHSMTHAMIDQVDDDQLARELHDSKKAIDRELSADTKSFCYPNGNYDARSMQALKEAGYSNAVTTQWGQNKSPLSYFTMKRCDMDARRLYNTFDKLSGHRLAMRLAGLQPGLN
jgi:peptidoglycan/xylan/chitin deacetylase (PgdA/CDA1 family)